MKPRPRSPIHPVATKAEEIVQCILMEGSHRAIVIGTGGGQAGFLVSGEPVSGHSHHAIASDHEALPAGRDALAPTHVR